jgi:hypothetical protein
VRILVDADACPVPIRDILLRASSRLGLPVVFVANQPLRLPQDELVSFVQVRPGADMADHYIAQEATAADLVITADIPLAARVIEAGAPALNPRGEFYTPENIGERLAMRDFFETLRGADLVHGGPRELRATDHTAFANALDRHLTERLRDLERDR